MSVKEKTVKARRSSRARPTSPGSRARAAARCARSRRRAACASAPAATRSSSRARRADIERARGFLRELARLRERGLALQSLGRPARGAGLLPRRRGPGRDLPGGRPRRPEQAPGLAQEPDAAALRAGDPRERPGARDRPGGNGQDLPRDGDGGRPARAEAGLPDHPDAARGGGRRAPRLPPRRPLRQDPPLPAAALRRALPHGRPGPGRQARGARHDRGRAARLHARAHAERLVRDPRRGPELDHRADEDVPDPPRLRLQGGHHRGRDPDRPALRAGLRADRGGAGAAGGAGGRDGPLHRARRGAPRAGAEDHPRLRAARGRAGTPARPRRGRPAEGGG